MKNREFIFKEIHQDNIYDTVHNLETIDDCGILVFKGFHYFSYHTIKFYSLYSQKGQEKPIFFLAYKNEILVGALKLGHYVRSNYDFWSVNYIDVHKDYRQEGIATFLYKKLNEWSKGKSITIIGTNLSKDGEKARINKLRKRILTNVKTYDSEQEFYQNLFCIKA